MAGNLRNICEDVEIDGKAYRINTDFRIWIEIERLLFDRSIDDEKRFANILVLAYPALPPRPYSAIERIMWFYSGGGLNDETSNGQKSPAFDILEDFDYIWAAFWGEFGIDLTRENLHWWKFRALLGALSDKCLFSKIVGYRTVDTSVIKDKEQKKFYEKMKKQFCLKSKKGISLNDEEVAEKLEAVFD